MALGFNIWQEDEGGKVSVRRAYMDAIEHTYEWHGHEWRMRAESNTVLVIERDGIEHRIKCVNNASTYGNVDYQIMKTQIKFMRFGVAWFVAHLSAAFRNDDGTWKTGREEKWYERPNQPVADELEHVWRVRPLKAVA